MNEIICLTEGLLIGAGAHKKVYTDPLDGSRCIKIVFPAPDSRLDIDCELKYRNIREKRGLVSNLLPAYYGTVQTNLGTGYVFERIADFDGNTSKTLQQLFSEAERDTKLVPFMEEVLSRLRGQLFQELIITSSVEPVNYMLQRTSATEYRVRIVDNIGGRNPVYLPLAFYLDVLAKSRVKRYWRRFLDEVRRKYPGVLSEEVKRRLW